MHRLRVITTFVFAAAQCPPFSPSQFPFHMSCWLCFPHPLWRSGTSAQAGSLHSMNAASCTDMALNVCVCGLTWVRQWSRCCTVCMLVWVRVLISTESRLPIMHRARADQRVNGAGYRLKLRSTATPTSKSDSSNNASIFLLVSTWEKSQLSISLPDLRPVTRAD